MSFWKSVLTIVCVILMVLGTGLILASQRSLGGWRVMVVKSGSMAPAIPTGSLVVSQTEAGYKPGEIITFVKQSLGNSLVTHRVVGLEPDGTLVTKGDANPVADQESISPYSVLGKVVWFVPLLGYGIGWLQTPVGVMLGIVIPGTLLIYEEFRSLYRKLQGSWLKSGVTVGVVIGLMMLAQVPGTMASYANYATLSNVGFATTSWIEPEILASRTEDDLVVALNNVGGYDEAVLEVTYSRVGEEGNIEEGLQATLTKDVTSETGEFEALYLGTCSDTDCIPHVVIGDVQLKVILKNAGMEVKTVESTFNW